jgi:hypothetical protein
MLEGRGARNRNHHRRTAQEPREGDLRTGGSGAPGDAVEAPAWPCEVPAREREPGEERQAAALADLEDVLGRAVRPAVTVLDGDDGNDPARTLELLDGDIRETDVANLPLVAKSSELADRLFDRHRRIRRMQLVKVDAFEAQPLQAPLAGLAKLVRPPFLRPATGARPA